MCSYNNWCYVYRNIDLTPQEFDEDEFWEEAKRLREEYDDEQFKNSKR